MEKGKGLDTMFNQKKAVYIIDTHRICEFKIGQNHFDIGHTLKVKTEIDTRNGYQAKTTRLIRLFIDKSAKFIAVKADKFSASIYNDFEKVLKEKYPDYTFEYKYSNRELIKAGFYGI